MNDSYTNFVRYSKGTTMAEEHHWVSRPRACADYRNVEYTNPDATADKRHSRQAIVNFTWETAQ